MPEVRIVGVVTLDEYERLLRARLAHRRGYWDEFDDWSPVGPRDVHACRLAAVRDAGPPNWTSAQEA